MSQIAENIAHKGTLLFVDDESNILSSLNRLFRPLGYQIFTANGGAKGLEVLQSHPVDLVISDMRMPEMDGAAFLEQVAQRWPSTVRLLLTGYADMKSTIAAINRARIYRYIAKPWEDNDIVLTVRQALEHKQAESERLRLTAVIQKQNEQLKEMNSGLEARVKARTEELRQTVGFLETTHEALRNSYTAAVRMFSSLVELREGVARGHSQRIAEQARLLSGKAGMSESDMQNVQYAALLHDIGKIGLPDKLMSKPFYNLTSEERKLVEKHPELGQAILMSLEALNEAGRYIRHHHERFDGAGFPDRLKGEQIPLGARVLAIVNDFDALLHGLLTPETMTTEQAKRFLQENRGKRYDPNLVDLFLAIAGSEQIAAERAAADKPVKTGGLCTGMVLARDLLTKDGLMLLPKGSVLDERIIARIQNYETSFERDLTIFVVANPG